MRTEWQNLRIGVVGVGSWGAKHVRALRSTPGVRTVVSIDQRHTGTGGRAAIHEPRRPRVTAEYADLTQALPAVDAVVITTPPATHAELAMQAIQAGKHVLVEKPMATTVAQAQALIDAADAAGVVLMAGHTFEHNSAVRKLRDLVRGRELGKLYYLDCTRLKLGLYKPDVNVITDLAPHDISISNFVLGTRPTVVTAWGSRHVHPDYEDVAHLQLDYADAGVQTHIHVSWLDPHKVHRVTAVGSQKMAVYNDLAEDERIRVYDRAATPPTRGDGPLPDVAYRLGGTESPFASTSEPLAVQDQHFVDCIAGGIQPSVDGRSGLAVVEVLECAQISLTEQRPVALAEVTRRPLAAVPAPAVPHVRAVSM